MAEFVPISLKRAAVALAQHLDYARAAEQLGTSSDKLRMQVSALEAQLCFHIFRPEQEKIKLTKEGQFLIKVFRESVALHDRTEKDESGHQD